MNDGTTRRMRSIGLALVVVCLAGGTAAHAQVAFVPGDWPASCAVRLKESGLHYRIARKGCTTAPAFKNPEYSALQAARDELSKLQPRFEGVVFLVDDRNMSVEMRMLFDDLVFAGSGRARVLSGLTWVGRDPTLVVGILESEGLEESEWRERVRLAAHSYLPSPDESSGPVCSEKYLEDYDAEQFRRLGAIAGRIREVGLDFVKRRETAVEVLVQHVGAEEVKRREKFKLTQTILRSAGSQVVGLATANGSKLMPGGRGHHSAGRSPRRCEGRVQHHSRHGAGVRPCEEAERGDHARRDSRRRDLSKIPPGAALARSRVGQGKYGALPPGALLRHDIHGARRVHCEVGEIFGDLGSTTGTLDQYYGTQSQVELATFEGYIRAAGNAGKPGYIRVDYEYDEDESREGSTYTFKRKSVRVEVARGRDAMERNLNAYMDALKISDVFELDVDFQLCTTGDWTEGSPGERSTECVAATPVRCARQASGASSRRAACDSVDWKKTSRSLVRRAIIGTPSNVFHLNAQTDLNRSQPDWMDRWARFSTD